MTLIVETGAGVRLANSYNSLAFITQYLQERNRVTQNGWQSSPSKEAAAIAATQYMDIRFGAQLQGHRAFVYEKVQATGSIAIVVNPTAADTITIVDQVYTFVAVLTGAANEVLIGADADTTAASFGNAISAESLSAGVTHGLNTPASRHVTETVANNVVSLTAVAPGTGGNATTLAASNAASITLTQLSGGQDGGTQPLEMPRINLCDRRGVAVEGIPLKWRWAHAEYSVRALASELFQDPAVSTVASNIRRTAEGVGPLREETEYFEGGGVTKTIQAYPAADKLVAEFLCGGGRGGLIR